MGGGKALRKKRRILVITLTLVDTFIDRIISEYEVDIILTREENQLTGYYSRPLSRGYAASYKRQDEVREYQSSVSCTHWRTLSGRGARVKHVLTL